MRVYVSQKMIDKANDFKKYLGYTASCQCPIALALKNKTKKRVAVYGSSAIIADKKYTVGQKGKDFIRAFDYGDKVEPCHVNLSKEEV